MASVNPTKKTLRDASVYGIKLTKVERKIAKKQNRKLHILQQHNAELASVSNDPTPHLLVGNGGLMCGIERNHLANLFGRFGTIKQIVMLPSRSYSFVSFDKTMEAKAAFDMIHGQSLDSPSEFPRSGVKFYLTYLVDVPNETGDLQKQLPPGLKITEDFVNEQDEKELMETLGWKSDDSANDETVHQQLHHRKVKHYGYEFLYKTNNVDITKPLLGGIPAICNIVIESMMSQGIIKLNPDQLTINQYEPGQGIPPHIDTHSAFENEIISLSLGDQVTMDFRHPDGHHLPVVLPRRSLTVMTGESRYLWTHGITPRKYDIIHTEQEIPPSGTPQSEPSGSAAMSGITLHERRTRLSFTFRKVRQSPCNCNYPEQCDSQKAKETSPSKTTCLPNSQREAAELEKKHVHDVYENIAEHFSGTRHSPWPNIAEFLRNQPAGSLVADVGCGNGKYLGVNEKIFSTGSDRSFNLAAICKQRGYSVIVCDILSLPYRSNAFDVCICIAVLHHLATDERRLAAVRELVRVVRSGGQILLYVWALEQEMEKVKMGRLKEKDFNENSSEETPGSSCSSNLSLKTKTTQDKFDSSSQDDFENQTFEKKKNIEGEIAASDERGEILPSHLSSTETAGALSKLCVNENRNVFEQQDIFVPWKYKGVNKTKSNRNESKEHGQVAQTQSSTQVKDHVYHRYYHVFKEGELIALCERLSNVVVLKHYYEKGNWCVLLEKLNN